MTHEQRLLGTVRVDARGRVYLKHVVKGLGPNAVYALYVDDETSTAATEESGSAETPKTIRMRLVE